MSSVKRQQRARFLISIPGTANCSVDSRKQGFLLQRLPEARYKRTFVRSFVRTVRMRGDEDGWNSYAVAYEMLLKLQAVHLRHLEIDNQAFGKPRRQRREKILSRFISLGMKSVRTQQPTQCLEHGRIIVHNSNPW